MARQHTPHVISWTLQLLDWTGHFWSESVSINYEICFQEGYAGEPCEPSKHFQQQNKGNTY